jgi:hypothetical protein
VEGLWSDLVELYVSGDDMSVGGLMICTNWFQEGRSSGDS